MAIVSAVGRSVSPTIVVQSEQIKKNVSSLRLQGGSDGGMTERTGSMMIDRWHYGEPWWPHLEYCSNRGERVVRPVHFCTQVLYPRQLADRADLRPRHGMAWHQSGWGWGSGPISSQAGTSAACRASPEGRLGLGWVPAGTRTHRPVSFEAGPGLQRRHLHDGLPELGLRGVEDGSALKALEVEERARRAPIRLVDGSGHLRRLALCPAHLQHARRRGGKG